MCVSTTSKVRLSPTSSSPAARPRASRAPSTLTLPRGRSSLGSCVQAATLRTLRSISSLPAAPPVPASPFSNSNNGGPHRTGPWEWAGLPESPRSWASAPGTFASGSGAGGGGGVEKSFKSGGGTWCSGRPMGSGRLAGAWLGVLLWVSPSRHRCDPSFQTQVAGSVLKTKEMTAPS